MLTQLMSVAGLTASCRSILYVSTNTCIVPDKQPTEEEKEKSSGRWGYLGSPFTMKISWKRLTFAQTLLYCDHFLLASCYQCMNNQPFVVIARKFRLLYTLILLQALQQYRRLDSHGFKGRRFSRKEIIVILANLLGSRKQPTWSGSKLFVEDWFLVEIDESRRRAHSILIL